MMYDIRKILYQPTISLDQTPDRERELPIAKILINILIYNHLRSVHPAERTCAVTSS